MDQRNEIMNKNNSVNDNEPYVFSTWINSHMP